MAIGFVGGAVWGAYGFLAITKPVDGEFLVVEGWVPSYVLRGAIREFEANHYQRFLVTGGPMVPDGLSIEDGDTFAQHTAGQLVQLGVKRDLIETVPATSNGRDRTYTWGVTLRKWFQKQGIPVKAINVVTLGPHARRSRLLTQKAFQGKVKIGIIAFQNQQYDPHRWWRYSEGVKEVMSEGFAYLYARLFFHPSE